MIECRMKLHYQNHEVSDDWLVIYIPEDRVDFKFHIISCVKEFLEKPATKIEEIVYDGDFVSLLEERIKTLEGIICCDIDVEDDAEDFINIQF